MKASGLQGNESPTFKVKYGSISKTINNNSSIIVPYGSITITASTLDGYNKPASKSTNISEPDKTIIIEYVSIPTGLFIVDNNFRWYKKEQWDTSNNAAARGVGYSDGSYAFIILKEVYYGTYTTNGVYCYWGEMGVDHFGGGSYSNMTINNCYSETFRNPCATAMEMTEDTCIIDNITFAGKDDPYKFINVFDGDNLIDFTSSGVPMCCLPSAWELAMCDINSTEMNELLNYIDGDDFETGMGEWWTVHQADSNSAIVHQFIGGGYGLSSMSFIYRNKNTNNRVSARVCYRAWPDKI